MRQAAEADFAFPPATDGTIAAINLKSARGSAWARFAQDPLSPGLAEAILDLERLAAQFLGDLEAFDRIDTLATQFTALDSTHRAALIQAEVASTLHRFAEARDQLTRAARLNAPPDIIARQTLTIDQACGVDLDAVLAVRRTLAAGSGRLEDMVPLGAVLADLQRFGEAAAVYRQAFKSHDDFSPFPLAWVCFQLGMLWGELTPEPDQALAARWYRGAIAYVPDYVTARVHLAEICVDQGRVHEAEALLIAALDNPDPEVRWRLAAVLMTQGRRDMGEAHLAAARSGYDDLLAKHRLAFADHAAEFYADTGADLDRALELALANQANRPTRRAIEQVRAIAALADQSALA